MKTFQVAKNLRRDTHAAQLIGLIVHFVHLRLLVRDDVLERRQLLENFVKTFSGRWHLDVTRQAPFELRNDLLVLLQPDERAFQQFQAIGVETRLRVQLLPQLLQAVQALLQSWRLQRDGSECFLKVDQIRLQQVQAATVIVEDLVGVVERVEVARHRRQDDVIQLAGHLLQARLQADAFLGEDSARLLALLC